MQVAQFAKTVLRGLVRKEKGAPRMRKKGGKFKNLNSFLGIRVIDSTRLNIYNTGNEILMLIDELKLIRKGEKYNLK